MADLGRQPSAEFFPPYDTPEPDPSYPVRLWLCSSCGLVQLADHDDVPEEIAGIEPEALRRQRAEAAAWLADTGLARPGSTVLEYESPHGGSWIPELSAANLAAATAGPREARLSSSMAASA